MYKVVFNKLQGKSLVLVGGYVYCIYTTGYGI